jgi:hypothetical protein
MKVLCASLLLLAAGCGNVKATNPVESPEAAQIRALEARVAALEKAKPQHQYQLINQGPRTFRFDSATGESCIQLASTADWKRPETIRKGCPYQDMVRPPEGATEQDKVSLYNMAECFYLKNCTNEKK